MLKTIWATVKEEIKLITKDPKAFLGAVMTALVVVLIIALIKVGLWYKATTDGRLTDKDLAAEKMLEMARMADRAQIREKDWRDTALKYQYLYKDLPRK